MKECLYCGKLHSNKKYCSRLCANRANLDMIRKDVWGGSSWNIGKAKLCGVWIEKSELPVRTCLICGTEFVCRGRIYCSRRCANIVVGQKAALVNKGKPTWNTNLTVETDERLKDSQMKRMKTINDRGYLFTEEQRKERSRRQKGKKIWCTGLTKETDDRMLRYALKSSEFMIEYWDKVRRGLIYREDSFVCRRPTEPEKLLDSILQKYFSGEWQYVGDGSFWIGRMNPDFVGTNGKKQVIEMEGCYWHGCKECHPGSERVNNFDERAEVYESHGYSPLEIWEHELGDEKEVVKRIRSFV